MTTLCNRNTTATPIENLKAQVERQRWPGARVEFSRLGAEAAAGEIPDWLRTGLSINRARMLVSLASIRLFTAENHHVAAPADWAHLVVRLEEAKYAAETHRKYRDELLHGFASTFQSLFRRAP